MLSPAEFKLSLVKHTLDQTDISELQAAVVLQVLRLTLMSTIVTVNKNSDCHTCSLYQI
jgi:hypothetical protein